jgi:hypothetical protein
VVIGSGQTEGHIILPGIAEGKPVVTQVKGTPTACQAEVKSKAAYVKIASAASEELQFQVQVWGTYV